MRLDSPNTPIETLGTKLRRLARQAAISNPLDNAPWMLSAAWAATTAYTAGQVVTNGGNYYICYAAGTSAGSGGPTGTGAGPITDNTVTWYYFGIPQIAASSPFAPSITLSSTTPSGLTSLIAANSAAPYFYFTGGVPTTGTGTNQYCFPALTVSATTGGNVTANSITGLHQQNRSFAVTFETDAPKFAIGKNNSSTPFRVIVDGRYVDLSATSYGAANPCWVVVDFTSAGGRKRRRITYECAADSNFAGVRVGPLDTVWTPDKSDAIRFLMSGSSYVDGGNSFPILGGIDIPNLIAKRLGWSDPWNVGIGGTGFISQGAGNAFYTNLGRVSDVLNNSPNILIAEGLINDTGSSAATVTAAVLTYLQTVRAAKPTLPIIVLGAFPTQTGPSAAVLATEAAGLAAVTSFADNLTWFCPIANDPLGPWQSGSGKVTATSGSGNNDVYMSSDGTHYTQPGLDYLSQRIVNFVRNTVLPSKHLDQIAA